MNIKNRILAGLAAVGLLVSNALAALPTGYTQISTDADATFTWAKEFAIGVVIFVFVMSLIKLARKR